LSHILVSFLGSRRKSSASERKSWVGRADSFATIDREGSSVCRRTRRTRSSERNLSASSDDLCDVPSEVLGSYRGYGRSSTRSSQVCWEVSKESLLD